MSARDDTATRRHQVDELLREIDDRRRRRLLLEASGAYAPVLEREAAEIRQQLAELVR